MSGRPARNCKRRSASEMLGKSPGSRSNIKSTQQDQPSPQKLKKAKLEIKKVETQKGSSPTRSKVRNEAPAAVATSSKVVTEEQAVTAAEPAIRRSSRRAAVQNSAPSKLIVAKPGKSIRKPPAVEPEEPAPPVVGDIVTSDPQAESRIVEEVVETLPDVAQSEATGQEAILEEVVSNDVIETSVQESSDVLVSSEVLSEPGTAVGGQEVAIVTSEVPEVEPGSTSQAGITVIDDTTDRTTLPQTSDANVDSELITLQPHEVIIGEHFVIETEEPMEVETLETAQEVTTTETAPAPVEAPTYVKPQRLITVESVKAKERVQSLVPLTVPEVSGPPGSGSLTLAGVDSQGDREEIPRTVQEQEEDAPIEMVAVTKTYIVGKDNRIQEVLVQPGTTKTLSGAGGSKMAQSAESDDEEFEYEEEDERIKLEGLEMNEPILFCDKIEENYPADELVLNMFERIKPLDKLDDHSVFASESGYRCTHCVVDDGVLGTSSKKELVAHLRREHIPEYAPWQCPLCLYKCVYPVSLLLHMSMHTKNKPFKCDKCPKRFVYKYKLQMHMKYHLDVAGHSCPVVDCKLVFHEEESLQKHMNNRHRSGKVVYQGDNKAIIQESGTSLGDALEMLVSGDGAGSGISADTKNSPLFRVQDRSIKMAELSEDGSITQEFGTNGGAGQSNLPISVVAQSDILGNPNSLVQIMPVSFRNDSGVPETINVVITVPQNDNSKLMNSTGSLPTVIHNAINNAVQSKPDPSMSQDMNSTDWLTKSKINSVDKELLEYCTVLATPIHYRNQRAFIKCKVCIEGQEVYFGSVTQFCEHLRKDHADKDIRPYKCNICDYKCRVRGNLDQHVKFHSKERPFSCTLCGKGFIQKYKLNLHLKFHENKREWKCDKCDSAFNDKQDLSRHYKNVHFDKESGVKCPHCERVFKNDYMLSQHVHVHTGERNYKCEVCHRQYSTKESLRSHMKGHQFQFGCEICAKPLGSYSAFIAHKRLHDPNQKGHTCEHCGKVLLFKATLEAHIKSVHSDVKDFMCDQCDKGFKTQAQLNNHMISHSKEKPYLCQICGYAVKRRDSLRQHMYRHADVKPYRCGRCGKEYTQKQALEIHLKSKHAGVTTFNCTMCDRGFNTNYLLKKHMQKSHGVELMNKMPMADQVIIAQQEVEDEVDSHPPAPEDVNIMAPTPRKQTVLINAHICEHCHEVFVSQHALAVHILSEHMNQDKMSEDEEAGTITASMEEGQVVNISETIEIPIGEEMVLVQSVEPGILSAAIEKGAGRVVASADNPVYKPPPIVSTTALSRPTGKVSLLPNKIVGSVPQTKSATVGEVVVSGDTVEEEVVAGSEIVATSAPFTADVQTVNILEDCEEGTVEQVVSTSSM